MITSVILGAVGFFSGATAFYLIHRFVFHSKKSSLVHRVLFSRWNPLSVLARWGREIHTNHHQEHVRAKRTGIPEELNMFFPWRVKLFVATAVAALAYISLPFAIGLVSFFPFYAYRHTKAHRFQALGKPLSGWMTHHLYHHEKNPYVNHSGTLPVIDRLFRTYKKT